MSELITLQQLIINDLPKISKTNIINRTYWIYIETGFSDPLGIDDYAYSNYRLDLFKIHIYDNRIELHGTIWYEHRTIEIDSDKHFLEYLKLLLA